MTIIDDSDSAEDDPISLVFKNAAGMANKNARAMPKYSCCVRIVGRLALEGSPSGGD